MALYINSYYATLFLSIKKVFGLELTETYFNYYVKENNEIIKNFNTYPIKYITGIKEKDIFNLKYYLKKLIYYSELLRKRKKYLIKKMEYNSVSESKLDVVNQLADLNIKTINIIIYLIDIIETSLTCKSNLDNINESLVVYDEDIIDI
jgi:hypothetical protein